MNNIINKFDNVKLFFINDSIKNNKIVLKKDNNFEYANIEILKSKINVKDRKDISKFKEVVKDFLTTLSQKSENFSPDLFLKNFANANFDINTSFENTKFIPKNALDSNVTVSGLCTFSKTNVSYYTSNFLSAYHELFHLSSFDIRNSVLISGFEVINGKAKFGYGINEGYTQFLTEKYFNGKALKSYKLEVTIIEILEFIVGKNKMETAYFNANPSLLFNELKKYIDEEQVNNFIVDFDDLFDSECALGNSYDGQLLLEIQKSISRIYLFLLKCLGNKIASFNNDNLSIDNIKYMSYLFDKSNWVGSINIDDKYKLNLLDSEVYDTYIEQVKNYLNDDMSHKKVS